MKIGVISDTHGLLRPEVMDRFRDVGHIIHAGDIGNPAVIAGLEAIAPVTAVRGNIDVGEWASVYPAVASVALAGRSFHVLHNLRELEFDPAVQAYDVVISGHSHQPRIETRGGVVYLNPGSAGPRRFKLPVTLAILDLTARSIGSSIAHLL